MPAFAVASVYSIRVVGGGVFSGAIVVHEIAPRYGNGGGRIDLQYILVGLGDCHVPLG